MQMNELPPVHLASKAPSAEDAANASPEVFQQLGTITRQLHDTLNQLGVLPRLSLAAGSLPDARSRLNYIAEKTAAAANKVLNSVDAAKADHAQIAEQTRRMAAALVANPVKAVASGAVLNFVSDVEAATARIDAHLTDIMMAQDFHDLTGQVVARVVTLASELEDSLAASARPGDHSRRPYRRGDQSRRGRRPAGQLGVLSPSVAAPSQRRFNRCRRPPTRCEWRTPSFPSCSKAPASRALGRGRRSRSSG
jgi:chemotaxis protein CheZ